MAKKKKTTEVVLVNEEEELDRLVAVTEELTRYMEKTRIAEYVEYLQHPGKLLWTNFLIGIARGLGSTIGLAIVLALLFLAMKQVISWNLPVIGEWISKFIVMVEQSYQALPHR